MVFVDIYGLGCWVGCGVCFSRWGVLVLLLVEGVLGLMGGCVWSKFEG